MTIKTVATGSEYMKEVHFINYPVQVHVSGSRQAYVNSGGEHLGSLSRVWPNEGAPDVIAFGFGCRTRRYLRQDNGNSGT